MVGKVSQILRVEELLCNYRIPFKLYLHLITLSQEILKLAAIRV